LNVTSFIRRFIENNEWLLKFLAIVLVGYLILRSCFSVTEDSLPLEVHETINTRYSSCVDVKGTDFREGDNPQRECTELTTNVLGQGTIPQGEKANGVTEAICFRVLIENPYFVTQSQTQYEEIDTFSRIVSKVAIFQRGDWILHPDQYIQDSARWVAYACPGEFDITIEDWIEEY